MDFKPFPDIKKFAGIHMSITQKIHGSNAQIVIEKIDALRPDTAFANDEFYSVQAGSRNRWIYPGDDNYGFAAYVDANKHEIVEKLGIGQHFGEWAGPGINSGEGLEQKTFILFDWWKFPEERPLPLQMAVVPVLYDGVIDLAKIEEVMTDLKTNGSKLVPGFLRPEGVVINILGTRVKKVFNAEETQWTKSSGKKNADPKAFVDLSYLLQPIRLEKLLSRDENYLKNYPESLGQLYKDYIADLEKENQVSAEPGVLKKNFGAQFFPFAKEIVEKQLQIQGAR